MPNTRPLVAAATICEKVLQEKDGVLSAIRIVDTFYAVTPQSNLPEDVKAGTQVTALISLKSGDITGSQEVQLVARKPSGEVKEVGKWPVIFKGGEHGANFTINMMISATDFGLWWFDVIWQGEVLTSIPLKLVQQQTAEPQPEKH